MTTTSADKITNDRRDPVDIDPDDPADIANRNMLAIGRKVDPQRSASTLGKADADQLPDHLPEDPVELAPGFLACCSCGQATEAPRIRAGLIRVPLFNTKANGTVGVGGLVGHVMLARCPECLDRRQLAIKIAAEHPAAGAQLGSVVVDVIDGVLITLELLDKPLPDPKISDAELGSMIRTLSTAGRSATWETVAAERPGLCSPRPWGHVRQATRQVLLRGWIDDAAEQIKMRRPPVAVPPPPAVGPGIKINGGCALCGVDHVDVNALRVHRLGGVATAALEVWTRRESIDIAALGGPSTPDRFAVVVCPTCSDAVRTAGAVGPGAMELALPRHLEDHGEDALAQEVRRGDRRVVGWAGWVVQARYQDQDDPGPSAEPWSHLIFDGAR